MKLFNKLLFITFDVLLLLLITELFVKLVTLLVMLLVTLLGVDILPPGEGGGGIIGVGVQTPWSLYGNVGLEQPKSFL